MRIDNDQFNALNNSNSRSPVYVVELAFDDANTDLHYLTSHSVTNLTGNIINDTLKNISSTSQKINPEKANSTIGAISFQCLDVGLTDLQRTKLQSGDGLKGKRVRVFKGFQGVDWTDYTLIQTQIISNNISYKDGVYTFQCSDIQRVLRKTIFDVKETALSGNLTRTSSTVNVFDTSQFEMVKQPPSSSGITDAPGQTVGYLKIKNDDQIEIIRYTGKTATSFTGCIRGVLGTRPIEVEANANDSDQSTKVEEYIYLEMPAVMLAYAVYTGVIYGQVEGLPDHWHLGVSADFIRTSDFENIGTDWFDPSDFDKGVPAVIRGVTKTDGKRFIEQELLVMLGAFSPIYTNGEIGIRRLSPIIGDGGYGVLLNEDNIIKYGDLKHDLGATINKIIIGWNYVESRGGFTRRSVLVDPESISKHGESDPLELNLRALESSRHSYSTIKNRFDALRERYAGPPLRLQLTLAPTMNALEVGDIVRVELDHVQDFTQDGASLGRTFEIQRVQQNWITGEVKVDLFGSSDVATAVPEEDPDTVIVNSFYNSLGTEINAANFPGQVSSSNGITTITGTIQLNGTGNPNDAGSIYYCNEDLTLNAGATILLSNSPQLRVNGFFQVNGKIDGKGRGFPGGDGVLAPSPWGGTTAVSRDVSLPFRTAANNPTIGWPNPRQVLQSGAKFYPWTLYGDNIIQVQMEIPGEYSAGTIWGNSAPTLNLQFNGTDKIEGLVSELRASSGAGGNCCALWDNVALWPNGTGTQIRGSDGGASGCGIIIICKGADIGANGVIDTSGEDADAPATINLTSYPWATVKGSSGAGGAAAAVYWLIDGVTSNPPNQNAQNSLAFNGAAKDYVYPGDWDYDWYKPPINGGYTGPSAPADHRRAVSSNNPNKTVSSFYHGNRLQRLNAYQSLHKVQFITGIVSPDNDIDVYADEATFTLNEVVNTPKTTAGDRSTIEVAITPPASDDNYSFSRVEYRKQGANAWTEASPSKFESTFEVKSDGSVYEVRLRSVSKAGDVSPSGAVQTITTTNVSGRTNAELAVIYPLQTITNLKLDEGGTDFTGLGPNFEWDDDNNQLAFFSHYKVEIYNGSSVLLRTEKSVNPAYTYSVDKNRTDYKAQTTNDGFYTTIEVRVTPVSRYLNNLGDLYEGSQVTFTVDASTTNDPNNLRFYVIPSKTSDLSDDANLGGTADWSNVNDDGARPEDNATNGATWEDNITGQPDRQNVLNNLVDISDWESGGAIPSSLSTEGAGYADANSLIVGQGPFDFDEVVWQVKPQSASLDDGGFSFKNNVLINPAKVYRISCWFRASSTNGTLRFSPSNSSRVRTLDTDAVQVAPYQHVAAAPVAGKWYLAVMVIHPHNTTRTSTSGMSGIYDPDTGNIVSFFDEFKFVPTAEYVRSNFQYIDVGNTTDYVWFSRPRLETIDGSELRLSALMGSPLDQYQKIDEAPAMVNLSSAGTKLTGPSNITASKVSTGRYRITHNSGYSGKGVMVSPRSSNVKLQAVTNELPNTFDVRFYDDSNAAVDSAFTLIVDPDYVT